ncbi:ATP-binding cassette domain-containing protein [Thioalkalivibrio sp. HK1]|uniref:ATP-binding cassette domain-containing protein n=1 Tax=Thioalkalivibrio sp. HK1 TaxID=1469245 RepID=UPI0018CC0E7F|nr:ATP-binding cassette domain-containing protein [Thioalkalivibrio sp. HK1]
MSESAIDLFAPAAHDSPSKNAATTTDGRRVSEPSKSKDGIALEPQSPLMETRGLCFEAGGKWLLRDIDIDIRSGRRTVIMGANGAGKSLLLRLLHGLVRPTAGEVRWQGRRLDRAARRLQAMVFQRPVMLRRSVRGNLRFALAVRGIGGSERAERETKALARARLADQADRPARLLSGGEQQRLSLARALSTSPRMLFLDEPMASLDPASTHAVESLIEQAHAEGVAIVLVTHDKGQARRLGDDLIFLHAGRVVEAGPVSQRLDDPRSPAMRAWSEGRLYLEGE